MTGPRRAVPVFLLVLAFLAGCAPADPRQRILAERADWRVDVLSWAMAEGGKMTVSVRVSGPVQSELEQLTVRLDMLDGQDQQVGSVWRTLDLSGVQRGGPVADRVV